MVVIVTYCTSLPSFNFSACLYNRINEISSSDRRYIVYCIASDFGGLEVACWPLVPKFAGSQPAEAVGFLGRKNPQHAFLRRGSTAARSHVVALRHVKDP